MIAAFLTALAVFVSPDVTALPIPVHTCFAEVLPFEDSSYAAGRLIYDGVTISDGEWLDDLPAIGWTPAWEGTDCILTIPARALPGDVRYRVRGGAVSAFTSSADSLPRGADDD